MNFITPDLPWVDAPVNGCVVNLLARAKDNDNNKRSLLLETTGVLPQRKK
jgi:hypothetical protein